MDAPLTTRTLRVLHAIHDFLPRHRAGAEIYAAALCRELASSHHVTVLCADYDPARAHGQLTWRLHERLPWPWHVQILVVKHTATRRPRSGEMRPLAVDSSVTSRFRQVLERIHVMP